MGDTERLQYSGAPQGPANFQLQITITDILVMEIFGEHYQNVTQRYEVSKYCWENDADRLARPRVATNGQFVKKTQYLSSMIKLCTVKWAMYVHRVRSRRLLSTGAYVILELGVHYPARMCMPSPIWKLSRFMRSSLCELDWLNHSTLVIELNLQPLSLPKVGWDRLKFPNFSSYG